MNIPPISRRIIQMGTILLLLVIAWMSITGGINQLPRSLTIGQKVETALQIAGGLLSLLNAITCFYFHRWRRPIRIAWTISLMLAAGMSSVVWGPPMLTVSALFTVLALLAALAVNKLLRITGA